MGEVIQFIPKAERERLRLIREARAIYDRVFPSSEAIGAYGAAPAAQVTGANIHHNGGLP